jgi:hypothetical protein
MPQVCAKTGEPATKTIAYVPTGAPKWAYLAFLLGVIPGYLILRTVFPSARVKLPFSQKVRRRRTVLSLVAMFAIFFGVVILTAALADTGTDALGALIGALIGGAIITGGVFAGRRARTRVKVTIVDREVIISGAHPAFGTALVMQPTPDEQRTAFVNTSGHGKAADVPPQIKRWNWGAFFFGGIWAIGSTVWIGLVGFVPLLGNILVGVKGNEWAWRKKQ